MAGVLPEMQALDWLYTPGELRPGQKNTEFKSFMAIPPLHEWTNEVGVPASLAQPGMQRIELWWKSDFKRPSGTYEMICQSVLEQGQWLFTWEWREWLLPVDSVQNNAMASSGPGEVSSSRRRLPALEEWSLEEWWVPIRYKDGRASIRYQYIDSEAERQYSFVEACSLEYCFWDPPIGSRGHFSYFQVYKQGKGILAAAVRQGPDPDPNVVLREGVPDWIKPDIQCSQMHQALDGGWAMSKCSGGKASERLLDQPELQERSVSNSRGGAAGRDMVRVPPVRTWTNCEGRRISHWLDESFGSRVTKLELCVVDYSTGSKGDVKVLMQSYKTSQDPDEAEWTQGSEEVDQGWLLMDADAVQRTPRVTNHKYRRELPPTSTWTRKWWWMLGDVEPYKHGFRAEFRWVDPEDPGCVYNDAVGTSTFKCWQPPIDADHYCAVMTVLMPRVLQRSAKLPPVSDNEGYSTDSDGECYTTDSDEV